MPLNTTISPSDLPQTSKHKKWSRKTTLPSRWGDPKNLNWETKCLKASRFMKLTCKEFSRWPCMQLKVSNRPISPEVRLIRISRAWFRDKNPKKNYWRGRVKEFPWNKRLSLLQISEVLCLMRVPAPIQKLQWQVAVLHLRTNPQTCNLLNATWSLGAKV